MRSLRAAAAIVAGILAACGGQPQPSSVTPKAATRPRLVVFITVDQLSPGYFDRFHAQLTGGLARLLAQGASFTNAHQDHAITETAPGHASTMSGRFPRSTGITRNLAGVIDTSVRLIGAPGETGASPFRFRGKTVTDWLLEAQPDAKVLSVSGKDRGAILPIGRSKQHVYWYANNGTFTTSTWYRDALPEWVVAFNDKRLAHRWAGQPWNPLPDVSYPEPDSVPAEADGKDLTFPHWFPSNPDSAAYRVRFTPMGDALTAALALEGVRQLGLGQGPGTDLLAVSFSATDFVGHFWGPESREQHDQIIRLDRLLGGMLDTLTTIRGASNLLVVLTADHGGTAIPEIHGKERVDVAPLLATLRAAVTEAGGQPRAVELESGGLFVDAARLGGRLSVDQIVDRFLAEARKLRGVARVDRFADLATQDTTRDDVARRWLHMFSPDLAPKAVLSLEPGSLFKVPSSYPWPIRGSHGTPNPSDSHVPIIFMGPAFRPGRHAGLVRTVDIAPTLLEALGLEPVDSLDGRLLRQVFR